ncbi:uncharacterized protein LOC144654783 [Oculina patagonica]
MNYCSKPSYNYRQKSTEEEILPRLFTPNKARRAHDWLRTGQYDEKLAVLKKFWIKDEERQATDKVLKESFHPQVAPRVRIWLNEAREEEKKAIMKLFRTIASQPTPEKISTTHIKPSKPVHVPKANSGATKAYTHNRKVQGNNVRPVFPAAAGARKHGNLVFVAQTRTEFDIAPDWRAPMRSVVPMTQITRRAPTQERLPRLSKHACLHGQRDFVIHPEWIIH